MKQTKVACFGLGLDQKQLIKKLSKKYIVIGFDTNNEAPGIKYVTKHYSTPFIQREKIMNILKKERIQKIYSFATEAPQLLIGYLNSSLSLKGIKYHQISKVSNKLKFRIILKKNKISQPKFFTYDQNKKKKRLKKKIIAKPIIGSASENIFILNNIKNLDKNYKNFIFEEYYKTNYVYAIDGFYIKKKFFPVSISKKIKSKDNVFVDKKIMFNIDNKKIKQKSSDITEKICSFIKAPNTPVHHEFIFKNNKIIPIDFHLRGPGSGIYTYLMDKLVFSKIFEIQTNIQNINSIPLANFFSFIYFANNINEIKLLKKKIKLFKGVGKKYVKFNNNIKQKQNSTRDRIGVVYFEFNKYQTFTNFSKKFNKIL